jgi:hypothetical protein
MVAANKLPRSLKTFIVSQLAAYQRPSAVVVAVNQAFGVEVSRQHVERYDPTKAAGRNLSKELRAQFEQERKAYHAENEAIGIQHRPFRLRQLEELYFEARDRRNPGLALQILELAAKEVGLTRAREAPGSEQSSTDEPKTEHRMSALDVCRRIALIFQDGEREKARMAAEAAKVIDHE